MEILYIALLTIFASAIGAITGFGTSTIMIPVLLLFFPFPQTLLLVGIIHWFSDLWKIILFKEGLNKKLIIYFGVPGIFASLLGALLVFEAPEKSLFQALGIILIIYAFFTILNPEFKIKQNKFSTASGGLLSGIIAGVFGMGGTVRGAFLSAINLPKTTYLATGGFIGIIIDSSRIIAYLAGGINLKPSLLAGLLLFIPASFIGSKIAQKIVNFVPQQYFRAIIILFLFAIGCKLIFFP